MLFSKQNFVNTVYQTNRSCQSISADHNQATRDWEAIWKWQAHRKPASGNKLCRTTSIFSMHFSHSTIEFNAFSLFLDWLFPTIRWIVFSKYYLLKSIWRWAWRTMLMIADSNLESLSLENWQTAFGKCHPVNNSNSINCSPVYLPLRSFPFENYSFR